MLSRKSVRPLAILGLALATGCSSSGSLFPPAGNNPIKIESVPPGADVYVMGDKVGVTPTEISRDKVFPNIYPNEKLSSYGKVTLRKSGCADYTSTISGEISSLGLHAKLDCAEKNPAPAAAPIVAPGSGETAEQRLEKIKDLLNKGLITEDEAKQARARILNGL